MRGLDAGWIALSQFVALVGYGEHWLDVHTAAATLAIVAFHFGAQLTSLYQPWRGAGIQRELVQVWTAWFLAFPVLLLVAFATKTTAVYSRVVTTSWLLLAPTLMCVWRAVLRHILGALRARGRNTRTTAIVGQTELGERVAGQMQERDWLGLRLVGFYDDRMPDRCHPVDPSIGHRAGNLDDLVTAAKKGEIDLIYIALPLRAEPRIAELVRKLADTTASVYMAADFYAFDLLHARWGALGDVPVVSIHETPFYGVDGWLKRLEDLVLGTMILGIIAMPMFLIALAVKLTSRGPIFFKQRRYGLDGEVIEVLKFRSMSVMEDGAEVKQATKNDSRITKVGAFLRRTSLDELPQFLHVLTGKMSIVGPRPHAVAHNEMYRTKIQGYMLRHKVKPGITGWAQVNGWRGETDTLEKMEKRVEHDLDYIRNWDLFWDLKIIFLTVFGSKVRKNAY